MARKRSIINPMSEFEEEEIIEINETIAEKFEFKEGLGGKWMLFYDAKYLDDMWKQAVALYRAGELDGIVSVRTSTAAECPRAGEKQMEVIRFTCGPCDDEDLILKCGLNLVKKMKYFSSYGFVAYKTDEQSLAGTKATGAVKNFMYRLPVSTHDHLRQRFNTSSEYPIELPSCASDRGILREAKHTTVVENMSKPLELDKAVKLRMLFEKGTTHDAAWVNACRLYRNNQLDGVLFLSSSTNDPRDRGKKGVIWAFCHPDESVTRVREIRVNLARQLITPTDNTSKNIKIAICPGQDLLKYAEF